MSESKIVEIKEVEALLKQGKSVRVKTKDGQFTRISNYVSKGMLDTFRVTLNNGLEIKVSREHKFFTNAGWVECKDLHPRKHLIFCEDGKYNTINSIEYIGQYKIVDITVEHPECCYFGNGMLNHNTGKSLVCAHIVANTQKKGGVAAYIDTESAAAPQLWKSLGVNLKDMTSIPMETIEGAFQKVEDMIGIVRKSNSDRLCTIIIDSIAGASTKTELEDGYERKGFSTAKSLIVGAAMRKLTNLIARRRILLVMTNQLRQNLSAMAFGDKWVEPCGKATSFHSSVKVRFEIMEKLKNSDKEVVGVHARATVRKNRLGPPFRQAEFDMYFDSGIADYASWIDIGKKKSIIDGPMNALVYDGQKYNSAAFVKQLNENDQFRDKLYKEICDAVIMQYKTPNSAILENIEKEVETEEQQKIIEAE